MQSNKEKITILFQPSGRKGQIEAGKNILQAAQDLGVGIESVCGGKHTCGKCRVRVEEGFFERGASESRRTNISAFLTEESKFIDQKEREAGYRLACAALLQGDILIYLPEESRAKTQAVGKDVREMPVELNPGVKSYYLELPPPSLKEIRGDFERLKLALEGKFLLKNLSLDILSLQCLPQRLRDGDGRVTALVWMDREIVDIRPGRAENFYGLAVDIGTTTVAAYLCHLKTGQIVAQDSLMNPQVIYGEDVMTRITYAMMHPQEGLRRMHRAIIEGLNGLISSLAKSARIHPEDILELVVVGNTAMHHIFLGVDPQYLGLSPFPPAVCHSLDIKARDLDLKVNTAANIHLLPLEAGFVGADNVGVLIAETPYEKEEMVLIIDLGTNGELALGNKKRLLCASCATGPALEGAHLQFGMRAAPGAIEKVRIDPRTFEVKYKVIGREKWNHECTPREIQAQGICGSGIIEVLAEMIQAGLVEKSGRFNSRLRCSRLRQVENGYEFVIAWAEETALGRDITVSASDIQAVQLAKGAIYAGAKVLMKILRVERLDKVILAGAFGSSVDRKRAMILGMFPNCPLKNVISVGNAAGDGARLALLNREKRAEAERIARQVEYVELTSYPNFAQEFIEALHFPHMRDHFPHLPSLFKSDA